MLWDRITVLMTLCVQYLLFRDLNIQVHVRSATCKCAVMIQTFSQ